MKKYKKQIRVPFLETVRKAFLLIIESQKSGTPPLDELIDLSKEDNSLNRRKFIGDITKLGLGLGLAGALNACNKASDIIDAQKNNPTNSYLRNTSSQKRVAIIGAGIAGLNCAFQLKKRGYYSTIFEGSSRIGGRIHTRKNLVGDGIYTECGGEFIDRGHRNMISLANEFGLPLIDTLIPEESAYLRDSFYIDGRLYTEAEITSALAPYAAQIHTHITSLPGNFGFNISNDHVQRFDQMSISGYFDFIGLPSSSFLRKGLEVAYLTEYGLEVSDQSAINFLYLFMVNPSNNNYKIYGVSDERYKIMGGNQRVIEAINNNLPGQVQLNKRLEKISVNNSNIYKLNFSDGSTFNADIVVLTIPFSLLRQVDLSELNFPEWKTNAIQNLGYGTNAKLIMGFNQKVWRNYQNSGYIFSNGNAQMPTDYIQTGWDNSTLQQPSNGGYTVFQGGNLGMELSLNKADLYLNQMEQIWPGTIHAFNGNKKLFHWPSYEFSKGSYGCWRVGQVSTIVGAEGIPVGNIYFAGEHTSFVNQGYMEGGAETGKNVANTIASLL